MLKELLILTICVVELVLGQNQPRVAIIGAGIGGSSAVHYLRDTFEDVQITVFEKSARIGGRTHTIELQGHKIELGASFIISENKFMIDMVREYGLSLENPIENSNIGMVSQNRLQMVLEPSDFSKARKLYWRYGWSIFKFMWKQKGLLEKFKSIYSLMSPDQPNGPRTFKTLDQFLEMIELKEFFNKTTRQVYVEDLGINEQLVNELLGGVISDFYNQNEDVNGFTGMVSASGFLSEAYKIKEGNNRLSEKILETHTKANKNVQVKLQTEILAVHRSGNRYKVFYEGGSDEFDVVIVATPLETTNIKFIDVSVPVQNSKQMKRKTILIHKYYVTARKIKASNLKNDGLELDGIFSADRILGKISFLHKLCHECIAGDGLEQPKKSFYEFTANQTVSQDQLEKIFSKYEVIKYFKHDWPYPNLADSIGKPLPEIVMAPGLYYVNSMEYLASCQELEALSSRNIVNLIQANEGYRWVRKTKKHTDL